MNDSAINDSAINKPILNLDELELQPRPEAFAATGPAAEKYDARMAMVSRALGASQLGYNVIAVPPGMRAFPFHNHRVREEMFFILQGTGEVRVGEQRYPIRQGDFIACPAGDAETAHQIINTSEAEIRYLCVSTQVSPEICDYPDTGKFGILGEFTNSKGEAEIFMHIGRHERNLDYWEGE